MEMSVQYHNFAVLPPGKGFPELIEWIFGWAPEPAGKVLRKVPVPLLGIESRFFG